MATYSVVAHDGQLYGPVDENGISEWIRQGRVQRDTLLHCHETNARTAAWTVPALQPALGLSTEEANDLLRAAQSPPAFAPPPPQPGAGPLLDYRHPPGYGGVQAPIYGGPPAPMISTFPVVASVLLCIFVPFFALIYYGIVHGNLPRRRPDDPGAGKAIGFMFIPFFNIYWLCFFWVRLCTRINDERVRVGLPATAPRTLVIAILCTYLALLIPILNILALLALLVMLVLANVQIQQSLNGLAEAACLR